MPKAPLWDPADKAMADADKTLAEWKAKHEEWKAKHGITGDDLTRWRAEKEEGQRKAKEAAEEKEGRAITVGGVGVLRGMKEGALTVPVGVDSKAVDALYKAIVANDEDGANELIDTGRMFVVDVGTKVKLLDNHGFFGSTAEIRILEGANKGRRGYVSSQLVVEK